MKKRLFWVSCAVTVMAGTVVLSSCGNAGEEYSYNPELIHGNHVKDYQAAFVQKYGEISPYETWDLSQRGSTLAGTAGTRGSKRHQCRTCPPQSLMAICWMPVIMKALSPISSIIIGIRSFRRSIIKMKPKTGRLTQLAKRLFSVWQVFQGLPVQARSISTGA